MPPKLRVNSYTLDQGGTLNQELNYKVYCALFTQMGTNDPVVTVLQNTIGPIVWTRQDVGDYIATLAGGGFPIDKCYSPPFGNWLGSAATWLPLHDGNEVKGYYTIFPDDDVMRLISIDPVLQDTDLGAILNPGGPPPGSIFIEMRVYP